MPYNIYVITLSHIGLECIIVLTFLLSLFPSSPSFEIKRPSLERGTNISNVLFFEMKISNIYIYIQREWFKKRKLTRGETKQETSRFRCERQLSLVTTVQCLEKKKKKKKNIVSKMISFPRTIRISLRDSRAV